MDWKVTFLFGIVSHAVEKTTGNLESSGGPRVKHGRSQRPDSADIFESLSDFAYLSSGEVLT